MSHLLHLLGRGLGSDLGDLLDRYFWSPQSQSLADLQRSCEAHPDWPDIRLQLALAYLRGAEVGQAVTHLRLACRSKPDYLPARLALASAYGEQGNVEAAAKQIDLALSLDPQSAYAGVGKARLLIVKQEYALARKQLDGVLERDADYMPAWSLRGDLDTFDRNSAKAEVAYTKAIENRADNLDDVLKRVLVRIQQKKYAEAQKDIDALKNVADGVNAMRSPDRSVLVITHYQRLLDYIVPDHVHVLAHGRIVRSGGKELAQELEKTGYAAFTGKAA